MPYLRPKGKWSLSWTHTWGGQNDAAHRVHVGGWWDVIFVGLWRLNLGTAALGATSHIIELPILGGFVDLSYLKRNRQGDP